MQKGGKHLKPKHLTSYKGPKLLTSKGKSWTENDFDKLTEAGFRRWVITNFFELKEHVLTQCKETENLEKGLDEMLTRITSLDKNKQLGAEKHSTTS